jgi:hydrocephalus-inducing protein
MNYVKKQTAYTVRIEKLGAKIASGKDPKLPPIDFTVENPTINAPPTDSHDGVEVPVNIRYEPSTVGESRAQLTVSSPDGGEYQCYLIGTSVVPQPKGPYEVTIFFNTIKNILGGRQRCQYRFQKSVL